jgi:DNA-binding IclR family transcriptional regulator
VHLGILENDHVVYVDKLASSRSVQLVSRLGASIPVTTTALGKAICSALPTEKRERLLEGLTFPSRTLRSIQSLSKFKDDLASTHARGYAIDDSENEDGVICVGAAIPDPLAIGKVRMAISVSGPDFRMRPHIATFGRLCGETATEIGRAIGLLLDSEREPSPATQRETSIHMGTELTVRSKERTI